MACIAIALMALRLSLFLAVVTSHPTTIPKVFDVRSYGAKGDGKTDNTNAFLKTWKEACAHSGRNKIYVPRETYYMTQVTFKGPCKGELVFFVTGTLLAPVDAKDIKEDVWIRFRNVDNLVVSGGGTIDGQGSQSWSNYVRDTNLTRRLPASMGFDVVRNSTIRRLKSLNSKAGHLDLYAVDHFKITSVNLTAPGNSPNTDGIKIAFSSNIKISNSHIGTGDDCIAILSGNTNFDIFNITCGPGHGISVGSLGKNKLEKNIEGFTVRNTVFTGTSDGIRFKTWESPVSEITVSKFLYENIKMVDVKHPINIEQNYCPYGRCPKLGESHVQIQNVTFRHISGTTRNKVAVNLHCSKSFPCKGIQLIDINLKHNGPGGPATALCENAQGSARGQIVPPSCLQ